MIGEMEGGVALRRQKGQRCGLFNFFLIVERFVHFTSVRFKMDSRTFICSKEVYDVFP